MKKLLLSLALICLLVPSQAQAVNLDGFYIAPKLSLTGDGNLGFGANVALGYDLAPMLGYPVRAEVEVGMRYSSDKVGNYKTSFLYVPVLVSGYYDFHLNSSFTPYVGVGLGMSYTSTNIKWAGTSTRDGNFDFSFALTGGTTYALTNQIDLDVAYRLNYNEGIGHQLLVGARYKF